MPPRARSGTESIETQRALPLFDLAHGARARPESVATRDLRRASSGSAGGGRSLAGVRPANETRASDVTRGRAPHRPTPPRLTSFQEPWTGPPTATLLSADAGVTSQVPFTAGARAPSVTAAAVSIPHPYASGSLVSAPGPTPAPGRAHIVFGPAEKAILILAGLSVVAVIVSTVLTSL